MDGSRSALTGDSRLRVKISPTQKTYPPSLLRNPDKSVTSATVVHMARPPDFRMGFGVIQLTYSYLRRVARLIH
jgi:hypothetical protein